MLFDLGLTECATKTNLHKMGHRYFTGAGSKVYVALYETKDQWVSLWFHAIDVEPPNGAKHINNLKAEVHPMYCDHKEESCFINIAFPLISQ